MSIPILPALTNLSDVTTDGPKAWPVYILRKASAGSLLKYISLV